MAKVELNSDHFNVKHIDVGQIHIKLTPKGRNHVRDHLTKDNTIVGLAVPAWNFYGPNQQDCDDMKGA